MHGLPRWLSGKEFAYQGRGGQGSLAGYRPWGHKESDTAEQLSTAEHSTVLCINKEAFCWNRTEKAQIYMKICHWLKIAYQISTVRTFKITVFGQLGTLRGGKKKQYMYF